MMPLSQVPLSYTQTPEQLRKSNSTIEVRITSHHYSFIVYANPMAPKIPLMHLCYLWHTVRNTFIQPSEHIITPDYMNVPSFLPSDTIRLYKSSFHN